MKESAQKTSGYSGNRAPRVTVVIPHASGMEILKHCLESLRGTRYRDFQVLVVDNASTDGSMRLIEKMFQEVLTVRSETNLGFAGGCNLGIRSCRSPYVVLLNNDTEVTPGWLEPLVRAMDEQPSVAAVQPKLLSFFDRDRFDYSGGAGGELDLFGYPFAWGRLFNMTERDTGQYERSREIFWASGAATLLRRSAMERVGLLDEAFFAHMEEIDLNWRFHWAGYHVISIPAAVVFHRAGGTLDKADFRKLVLNHRNDLLMVLKNHTFITLCWLLPMRMMLEGITIVTSVIRGDLKRGAAVIQGIFGVTLLWKTVTDGRRKVAAIRSIGETEMLHKFYRGSAALSYFVRGIRSTEDLWRQGMRFRD